MNHTKLDPSAALAQSFIISAHLIDEELHRYREYLRDVRGLATGTCHDRIRIIRQFLEQSFTGSAAIKITALLPLLHSYRLTLPSTWYSNEHSAH